MRTSARHRAREFALQGLYQRQLSGNAPDAIRAQISEATGFANVDGPYFDELWNGVTSEFDNLVALYEAGVGRGEDGVLTHGASRYGRVYLINEPLAHHPRERRGPAPYARSGWRLGLTATWGRAHTMRWLASDPEAYRREWRRLAVLELGRALSAAARRPWRASSWMQIAGVLAGAGKALARWETIPPEARSRKSYAGAA